jgi:hypothetical protein
MVTPFRYNALRIQELIIFDPDAEAEPDVASPDLERVTFQLFQRRKDGLRRVVPLAEDRVWSEQLSCWFRAIKVGDKEVVRIATGEQGEHLLPTPEETAEPVG